MGRECEEKIEKENCRKPECKGGRGERGGEKWNITMQRK